MNENEISNIVVNTVFQMHQTFGPELLEGAYEQISASKLEKEGLQVRIQKKISIVYEDIRIKNTSRVDLVIN
jgi:GxxExxY protein